MQHFRSGVVHFFEGAVYLGGQPLEPRLGKFPSMAEGAELRTADGRAEVLLTPGVFLRLGEKSEIRMVANDLSDTRVEMLAGSTIVDSSEPSPGTSVTLIYKNWKVRCLQQGVYRIDSEPPRVWVSQGKAEVSAGANGDPISVEQGMDVPFAAVLVPEKSFDQPRDTLSEWAAGREQSISADNTIAANIQDPASMDSANLDPDSFTYFPMLGLAPLGSSLYSAYSPFSSSSLYQPGVQLHLLARLYLSAFDPGIAAGWISKASLFTAPHRNFTTAASPCSCSASGTRAPSSPCGSTRRRSPLVGRHITARERSTRGASAP